MAGQAYFGVIKRATNVGTIGVAPLASDADCVLGTSTTQAVTPSGLKAAIVAVGGGLVWTTVTAAAQTMVKSNGYFSNRGASAVAFSLPAVANVGDTFLVANLGARAVGWTITYGTGQYIRVGNQVTTTTTGSLSASATGDSIWLVCSVASTEFTAVGPIGNWTVV